MLLGRTQPPISTNKAAQSYSLPDAPSDLLEIQMLVQCPHPECGKQYEIIPRPSDSNGKIRRRIPCPYCEYPAKLPQAPAGVMSGRESVSICLDGRKIALQEYECTRAQAQHFVDQFVAAWQHIPEAARNVISAYWASDTYAPYVWILNDRSEWGGRGWAAADPNGMSLYFVTSVVTEIPDEHIRLFVSHEIGHILFIALGESHHVAGPRTSEIAYKCERLVWDLMNAWGLDQLAAEEWMEKNFDDDGNGLRKRSNPLSGESYQGKCVTDHDRIEAELADFQFPNQFEQYRTQHQK